MSKLRLLRLLAGALRATFEQRRRHGPRRPSWSFGFEWLVEFLRRDWAGLATCESAGGNLALGLLIALRDVGRPLPAGAVLTSPWVDLDSSAESMQRHPGFSAKDASVAQHTFVSAQDMKRPHPTTSP